jgi:hypothetical protein
MTDVTFRKKIIGKEIDDDAYLTNGLLRKEKDGKPNVVTRQQPRNTTGYQQSALGITTAKIRMRVPNFPCELSSLSE